MSDDTTQVLFLCTHNASRSQMAEALLRSLGEGHFAVASAGTEPSRVHPLAVRAMAEIGIDIGAASSKHLNEFIGQDLAYVITVCDQANETCPVFPSGPERIHWPLPDPSAVEGSDDQRLAAFRRVRDDLRRRIQDWTAEVTRER